MNDDLREWMLGDEHKNHAEARAQELRREMEQIEEACELSIPYSECEWEKDYRLDDALEPMGAPEKILPLLGHMRSLYPDRDKKGILNPQRFPDQYRADLVEQMQNFDTAQSRMGFISDLLDIQTLFKKPGTETVAETVAETGQDND